MRERNDLTGDAVKINGVYLEDVIDGYITLSSSGRESLKKEITTSEIKTDGLRPIHSKFKEREIVVEYVIYSASFDEFQEKQGRLAAFLNVENAKVIFNNEPDKYLTGHIVIEADVNKEQHAWSGSFKIICYDPFKYSNEVKSVSFENRMASVNYKGTYKAYPVLTAHFPEKIDSSGNNIETSEYGYFGFVNNREDVLQFGDPEEIDYQEITGKVFTVINHTFSAYGSWLHANGSALSRSDYVQTGTITLDASNKRVYASGFGSGTKWHGPSVYMTIPKADDGNNGAKNFKWTINHVFKNSAKAQYGGFYAFVLDKTTSPGGVVGGVFITKTAKDNNCTIYGYAGSGSSFSNVKVACSKVGTTTITKEGGKLTITCGGKTLTNSPASFAEKEGVQVVFGFVMTGTKTKISSNYVTKCVFDRTNCTYRKEIENTFQPGMTVTADCSDASIKLGEEKAQNLGALGNDWENFYLSEGLNTIQADFTGWNGDDAVTEPEFRINYRERYL